MRKAFAIAGTAIFFACVPFVVVAVVPWWILRWRLRPPVAGLELTRVVGVALILAGAPVLLDSFARFALEGRGTPAPIAPPEHLVVTGAYRHVRNPMYVAVVSVILGQGLLLGDARLLVYAALFWLACHAFVLLYEEPKLQRTHGAEYEAFRANVPRWLPRPGPWRGNRGQQAVEDRARRPRSPRA